MKRVAAVVALGTLGLAACGGDDGGGGSASAWCDRAREVEESFSAVETADFNDTDAIVEAFRTAADTLEGVADDAPDAISDDVAKVAEGVSQLADKVEESGGDPEKLIAAFEDFDTTAFEEAGNRIEQYNEEECGIPAEGSDDTSAPADDTEAPAEDTAEDTAAPADDTTAAGAGDTLPGDLTDMMAESLAQSFPDLSEDQISCLAEGLMGEGADLEALSDPSAMLGLFEDCGVDPAELTGG